MAKMSDAEAEALFATGTPILPNPDAEAEALFAQGTPVVSQADAEAEALFATGTPVEPAAGESTLFGKNITRAQTDALAKKHGVDPEELSGMVPFFGGFRDEVAKEGALIPSAKDAGEYLAGAVGRGVAFSAPQYLRKKQLDPKMRAAVEDMEGLIDEERSISATLLEAGMGIKGAVTLGRTAGAATGASKKATLAYEVASGVGGGAAQQFFEAKEGEELESAAKGAAFGLAAVGVGQAAGPIFNAGARKAGEVWNATFGKKGAKEVLERVEGEVAERLTPEALQELAEADAKVAARSELEADSLLSPVGGAATGEVSPMRRMLAYVEGEVPGDAVTITREILSPEEITARASKIEARLAETYPQALRELSDIAPNDRALRDATLVSRELEAELKQTARLASGSTSDKGFQGTTKEALELLLTRAKSEGPDYIEGLARKGAVLRRQNELYTERVLQRADEFDGNRDPDFLTQIFDFLRDGKFVARSIDQRLGTNMEQTLDSFATNTNLYTRHLGAVDTRLGEVKALQAAGEFLDVDVYTALDRGLRASDLGIPAEKADEFDAVIGKWREFFEDVRKQGEELGLVIEKRDNYVPHKVLAMNKLLPRLEEAIVKVQQRTGVDLTKSYDAETYAAKLADDEAFVELRDSLSYLTGARITDPESTRRAVLSALDPSVMLEKLRTTAAASMQRLEDEVPALIRETNMSELASRWTTGTFRHAYLRETIDELRLTANLAAEAGDKRAADYTYRLMQDVIGVPRKGTLADSLRRTGLRMEAALSRIVRESEDPLVRGGAKGLLVLQQAMPAIVNQMYPNFLGFSVRAALQNVTGPYLMTVPELGYAYGSSQVLAGAGQLLADLSSGKALQVKDARMARLLTGELGRPVAIGEAVITRDPRVILASQGLLKREWNTELQNFLQHEVEQGVVEKTTQNTLRSYNVAAMYLYERAEVANRMTVAYMADGVSRDLIEGGIDGAQTFLATMGESYKRSVSRAMQAGDSDKVHQLVRDYLIGKTTFNYSRASLSQFGRSAGSLFSVFTKWPAHIAGDVISSYERNGLMEGSVDVFSRYMAPLMSLYLIDKALFSGDEENPFRQAFIGKTGLSTWAPVKSLASFADGNLLQPPVIGSIAGGIKAAVTLDGKETVRWLDQTAKSFVPGAALIRFFSTDVRALQGEAPIRGTMATQVEELTR